MRERVGAFHQDGALCSSVLMTQQLHRVLPRAPHGGEALLASSVVGRMVLSPSIGNSWTSGKLFLQLQYETERADWMTCTQELIWSDPMLVCGICEHLDTVKIF